MNIIVFGGSGFLGSHVCDELTNKGHNVTIFDTCKSSYLKSNQKMIIGDVLDKELVERSIKENDYVFHLAGIADLAEAKSNPINSANINIIGTLNILEACKKFKIKRIIFSSTVYIYSDHGSFYRVSKQACELYIENYSKEYNLDFTILRYGSLYGKRSNEFNFIRKIIYEGLTTGKMTRYGDGNEIRAYINISDAALATVKSMDEKYKNSYLMITGPQNIKVKEVLNMIKEMMSSKVEIIYLNGENDGHYKTTPYIFKPNIAKKINLNDYHELGQGILETIYDIKKELIDNNQKSIFN